MTVALRDDDVDLLHGAVRATGLGSVITKDQRGNAQAAWLVQRKADTAALVTFLRRFPLRSRKRRDFDIWKAAVGHWNGSAADRVQRMTELRLALPEARAYREREIARHTRVVLDRVGFYDWLGGFIAGDGYFGIASGATRLTVKLRADDAPLLAAIRATTVMGTIQGPYRNPAAHPSVAWNVCRTSELLELAGLLEGRVPGRKGAEFAVWRRAVADRADQSMPAAERRHRMNEAEAELKALRRYRPAAPLPSAKSRRIQRMYGQNREWLALLRQWAADEPGLLTAAAYNGAREPGWPTRDTLARRFGSWYDALAAAGLGERAAVSPDVRDARVLAGAERRAERQRAQRERVITAVRRCSEALGRFPRPTEYARWRLHNQASAPTFVTAYRLFPGGWAELRAACAGSA